MGDSQETGLKERKVKIRAAEADIQTFSPWSQSGSKKTGSYISYNATG